MTPETISGRSFHTTIDGYDVDILPQRAGHKLMPSMPGGGTLKAWPLRNIAHGKRLAAYVIRKLVPAVAAQPEEVEA